MMKMKTNFFFILTLVIISNINTLPCFAQYAVQTQLKSHEWHPGRLHLMSVAFSPDLRMIAGTNATVNHLWDVSTGKPLYTFEGHTDDILSVAFSSDGGTLASVSRSGRVLRWSLPPCKRERLAEDVNGDGIVNIQDLIAVAAALGETGESPADVNGDGIVNIQDLVAVAAALRKTVANAPAAVHLSQFSQETVQQWLSAAEQHQLIDPTSERGIQVLEQLLAAMTPTETALLANYPNPFNPETWIPYQLANPADVTVHIYSVNGSLVRRLLLGHQTAGMYRSRSRAAYWDGKNELGESVASSIYFYMLTAGDFTAIRKMLIRK